ncbi:hypothetical protein PENSPDRAFT_609280 [Peniophora sp. CONT]|nr:hypothetical protein PENSPDRAFT_609280 [Peniophora sp. CONT]
MSPVSPFFPRSFSPPPPYSKPPTPKSSVFALTRPRRPVFCTVFTVLFGILIYLNIAAYRSSGLSLDSLYPSNFQHLHDTTENTREMPAARIQKKPRIERLKVLRGEPTMRFRDNLRDDLNYVHSWISAGWTNDLMTYANVIYIGLISERVPIVHYFNWDVPGTPTDVRTLPFSEVFDLDRLSNEIQLPVVEWDEVKDPSSQEIEELGCWNVWEAVQYRDHNPRWPFNNTWAKQGLDISWTTAPSSVKIIPNFEHDQWARIWDLAALTFNYGRSQSLSQPKESNINHHTAPPDEQLACFDFVYFAAAVHSEEFWYALSPVWRDVGRHIHWQPALQDLGNEYMRRMFNVPPGGAIPPFISIHARRGDFFDYCDQAGLPRESCYPTMDEYRFAIDRLRSAIEDKLGVSPSHVIMLSDERDPAWWAEIRAQGWYVPDHEGAGTLEKYGWWYPVLLDAVIQSSGVGLLGTPGSTFSLVAGRRVMDWQGGVYHEIAWANRESKLGVPVP